MEIFTHSIGWIIGILVVFILALIGYYADKKEKKESSNKENDISNDTSKPIGEVNITEEKPVFDSNTDEIFTLNNETELYKEPPLFKNIEDAHMSMEDLERVNYESLIEHNSNINSLYNQDNNYFDNDYNINTYNSLIDSNNQNETEIIENHDEQPIEENNEIYYGAETVDNEEQVIENINNEIYYEEPNIVNNDTSVDQSDNTSTILDEISEEENHQFDNEVYNQETEENHEFESEVYNQETEEENINNMEFNYSAIPELSDSNLSSDTIDEDIWKF